MGLFLSQNNIRNFPILMSVIRKKNDFRHIYNYNADSQLFIAEV